MEANYELFDHTADIGIRACGPTVEDTVRQAVRGLYAAIGEIAVRGEPRIVHWELEGDDRAVLLRDLLSKLLVAFERDQRVAADVRVVEFTDRGLAVEVALAEVNAEASHFDREVKAVTYHELSFRPVEGGFEAVCIVDI